jgi:hypothetical protein
MVIDLVSDFFRKICHGCHHVDAGSSLGKIGYKDVNADFFHSAPPPSPSPTKGGGEMAEMISLWNDTANDGISKLLRKETFRHPI